MAYVARGAELAERRGDDVLGHRVGPHRLHEQRGHQHVTPEIGGVGGQPGHELLARAEQLEAAHLALQAAEAQRMRRVRPHGLVKPAKGVVEDRAARQRCERWAIGDDLDTNRHVRRG